MSPPVSSSAFLQSIIPAPVFSRSSFTSAEVISTFFFVSSAMFLFLGLLCRGRFLSRSRQNRLALDDRPRRLALRAVRLRDSLAPHSAALATTSAARTTASAAIVAPAAPLGGRVAIL